MTRPSETDSSDFAAIAERLGKLRGCFAESEIDSLLVTGEKNVRYLTGFTGDSSAAWVQSDRVTLLSDPRYELQIATQCPNVEAAIRRPSTPLTQWIGEVLRDSLGDRCGSERIGFEADHVSHSLFTQLSQTEPLRWHPTSGVVERWRAIKDAGEIECIRGAVRIAQEAMVASGLDIEDPLRWPEGATERSLAARLEYEMRLRGADGTSFEPIVAVDASAALPHYQPTDRPLSGSDVLLLDWGASYRGYASDMTRTFGRDRVDGFAKAWAAVDEAQSAAIEAIAEGVFARAIDQAARDVLDRAGLGEFFTHATGHGIGLDIHEAPRMGAEVETPLVAGMVVTVEPGVYLADRFGIRLEQDVLVQSGGCEVLSRGLEATGPIR